MRRGRLGDSNGQLARCPARHCQSVLANVEIEFRIKNVLIEFLCFDVGPLRSQFVLLQRQRISELYVMMLLLV